MPASSGSLEGRSAYFMPRANSMKSAIRAKFSPLVATWTILGSLAAQAAEPLPKELAKYDALIKPEHRRHWAFQPVKRPAIPKVQNAGWARNPIDAFVLARLEARGWQLASPADARAFLRRVYLDVIG